MNASLALLILVGVSCSTPGASRSDGGDGEAMGQSLDAGPPEVSSGAPEGGRPSSSLVPDAGTNDGAPPDETCSLPPDDYGFADVGAGSDSPTDRAELRPPNQYHLSRVVQPGQDPLIVTCFYKMPCSSATAVTVPAIAAAIANSDVQAALAKPNGTLFGTDPRPAGTVWAFYGGDGHGFLVGSGDVPAGLRALRTLLGLASGDMRASPGCAALFP